VLRNFRIEIAADSLVQIDEQEEKQNRVEFLTAVGAYIKGAAEVGMAAPALAPLLMELLKFGVTGFKVGKSVEGVIDEALEQLKPASQQPKPPDPKVEAEKVKAQAEMQKAQMSVQVEAQKAQIDKERMAAERQHDMQQMQIDGAMQQQDAAMQQQNMQMKGEQMQMQHQQKMQAAMMPKPPARKQ
jgi:hypothetical protein